MVSPCRTALAALVLFVSLAPSQETRGMIYGRVTDPQGAVVPGVRVTVTNVDTNTSIGTQTNASGYYEANLLLHGNYQVSFEAAGFRRLVRRGIVLPMSSRVEVSVTLELGPVAESVTVEAAAPLIDAVSASSGRVLDNRTQQALPTSFNNVTILARFTPGCRPMARSAFWTPTIRVPLRTIALPAAWAATSGPLTARPIKALLAKSASCRTRMWWRK
jgi:hypothetical protein